jgi:hypothetical protein
MFVVYLDDKIVDMKTIWMDIPQDYYELGFWGTVEKHVGLTENEFMNSYNDFLRSGSHDDDPPKGWPQNEREIETINFLDIVPYGSK